MHRGVNARNLRLVVAARSPLSQFGVLCREPALQCLVILKLHITRDEVDARADSPLNGSAYVSAEKRRNAVNASMGHRGNV